MNHHPPNPTTIRDRMLAAGFRPCDCRAENFGPYARAVLLHSPLGLHSAPPFGASDLARYEGQR